MEKIRLPVVPSTTPTWAPVLSAPKNRLEHVEYHISSGAGPTALLIVFPVTALNVNIDPAAQPAAAVSFSPMTRPAGLQSTLSGRTFTSLNVFGSKTSISPFGFATVDGIATRNRPCVRSYAGCSPPPLAVVS